MRIEHGEVPFTEPFPVTDFLEVSQIDNTTPLVDLDAPVSDMSNLHTMVAALLDGVPESLKELVIILHRFHRARQRDCDLACLSPLHNFRNLQVLHILTGCKTAVNDAGLATLAMAWPDLQELYLMQDRTRSSSNQGIPSVTLDGWCL